jgi:hypothetical protein
LNNRPKNPASLVTDCIRNRLDRLVARFEHLLRFLEPQRGTYSSGDKPVAFSNRRLNVTWLQLAKKKTG